jgi:prepilin-type N-terminal cleavage/methylation domain-containing protein
LRAGVFREPRVYVNVLHVDFTEPSLSSRADQGFSLIELLIVIVTLGILATLVVFSVRGITDRGQENSCNTDARTLATAVEAYFAQELAGSIAETGSGADRYERTLVAAGLLRDHSDYWNVAAEGYLTNVSPC